MLDNITSFLHLKNVSKQVRSGENQLLILRDINLDIKSGDTVAILGASGSGKSTLLSLMAGLDTVTSGEVQLDQYALHKLSEEERAIMRAKSIGFIFQSFLLLPNLTALENVMLPLEIQYTSIAKAQADAKQWLERVGLAERIHYYPSKLSGGEQQRVAIARAFVSPRKIIFADEMTGNLDQQTGNKIADILFSLNETYGTTLVLVTHDASLSQRCRKCYVLRDGVLNPC